MVSVCTRRETHSATIPWTHFLFFRFAPKKTLSFLSLFNLLHYLFKLETFVYDKLQLRHCTRFQFTIMHRHIYLVCEMYQIVCQIDFDNLKSSRITSITKAEFTEFQYRLRYNLRIISIGMSRTSLRLQIKWIVATWNATIVPVPFNLV